MNIPSVSHSRLVLSFANTCYLLRRVSAPRFSIFSRSSSGQLPGAVVSFIVIRRYALV